MAAAVTSGQSTTPPGVQSPAEKAVCETSKPKDSPDFVKGSGTFVMKLKLVAKDRFVQVEIKGENKTTFEGNFYNLWWSFGQVVCPVASNQRDHRFISNYHPLGFLSLEPAHLVNLESGNSCEENGEKNVLLLLQLRAS